MSRNFHRLSVLLKMHNIWQDYYSRILTLKCSQESSGIHVLKRFKNNLSVKPEKFETIETQRKFRNSQEKVCRFVVSFVNVFLRLHCNLIHYSKKFFKKLLEIECSHSLRNFYD